MLRTNNYTTLLLVLIVIILLVGVGIALYYVLDLDWFSKPNIQVYDEVKPYVENTIPQNTVVKTSEYDMTKRTYDILLETSDIKVVIYKDGTVGLTMLNNDTNKQVSIYKEIINKEIKTSLTNIVKVYEVSASKDSTVKKYIVLIDKDGNLYKLANEELVKKGKYAFVKIEGLAKIVDIKQITNKNVIDNPNGVNVIAIDYEGNELLLTDYLIK